MSAGSAGRTGTPGTASQVVTGLTALLAHSVEITELLRATGAPAAFTWQPLVTWLRQHPALTPLTVLIRRDGELVAAALLIRVARLGAYKFELMGERGLPGWLPALDESSAVSLAAGVKAYLASVGKPWVLRLGPIEAGNPGLDAIATTLDVTERVNQPATPQLHFAANEPLTSYLSANTRSALAKARNRIAKAGLASELSWTTELAEIDRVTPELVEILHARNVELNQNPAVLADPTRRAQYGEMVHAYASEGVVRLLIHRLGGEIAAYALCFESGGALYVYSNRMNPKWARYSAGAIANAEVVRAAHSDPAVQRVDWGGGIQRYKISGPVMLYPYEELRAWSGRPTRQFWCGVRWLRALFRRAERAELSAAGTTRFGRRLHDTAQPSRQG
ncbi:MAG: GNAT family N-acetyltransferase [Jatrophihabitantaceae bacterium]